MKAYINYFKLQIISALQYRTAALAGITTQLFWGFILLVIFSAFYELGNADQTMSFSELVPYIWLNQAFLSLIFLMEDKEIVEAIKNGSVCYELTKPYDLYIFWYIKIIAKKYASVFLKFSPVIIFSILMPAPYNLTAPASLIAFLLFIISMVLGSFIIGAIMMFVTITTFYTLNEDGIAGIIFIIARLLSGIVIPFPFLPDFIQRATYYLPFRLIGDLPFRIYTGNVLFNEALSSIYLQIFWIIALLIMGYYLLKNAIRRVYIQGG